ncbi:MAG: hypothetical protein L3J34_04120 [Flavobacteriaceae bacterium]|nr:hypothetical protein [Flavobacteriaceae bacterium]
MQNFEENVNVFVEESFIIEKRNYSNIIKDHIKESFEYEISFNKIEAAIYKKLNDVKFNPVYKDLIYLLEKIKKDYGIDKFNKAIRSNEFQEELKAQNKTLDEFISIHKEYQAEFEVLKFHHQNREIFKNYFMIKYNPELKDKIDYYDLNLHRGGRENDSLANKEVERLHLILNPPSKNKGKKLEKYGLNLSTKDVAVFMILFKDYYNIKFNSYVEFTELSRLFFDDLHLNIKDNEVKLGTSIKRYIKGKELLAGDFNFDTSQKKILEILLDINLKDFKKYIKKVDLDKFKSLIKQNARF